MQDPDAPGEVEASRPTFPYYQSHDGVDGMSDTRRKWSRLQVPADLSGRTVLDIGSNEGLLTSWCAINGAAKVIGIDFDKPRVEFAQQHYASEKVEFRYQRWDSLPEGLFDVILWTSAMHYERDPRAVIANIKASLRPGGLFILECGVIYDSVDREMVTVSRYSDVTLYPSHTYLRDVLLRDFSVRRVAELEWVPGDSVPRTVFHCRVREPTVLFVIGPSGCGKTDLVTSHLGSATKVLSLDVMISRVGQGQFVHGPLQETIRSLYYEKDLGPVFSAVQEEPLIHPFLEWLAELCAKSDDLVVIEGDLQRNTIEIFRRRFPDKRVWMVCRPS